MKPLVHSLSVLILGLFIGVSAQAVTTSAHGFSITVEPILGYEYFQRDTPTPHKSGMLIYGARFTAGRPHIVAEGEFTRGNDTEVFISPSVTTINTSKENVRLGLRGTYNLGQALSTFLRAGGQASKIKVENVDISGVSTRSDGAWVIRPYAGAGLQIHPVSAFSLGVDATYVFYSLSDFRQNSVQFSTSIRIQFNTR